MEWISVKDMLPTDNYVRYLTYDWYYEQAIIRRFDIINNFWLQEDWDGYYTDAVCGRITHWMPLPEPPKE